MCACHAALLACSAYDCVALIFEIIHEVPLAPSATLDVKRKKSWRYQ